MRPSVPRASRVFVSRVVCFAAGLCLAAGCGSAPKDGPVNVVLISIDSLRADHVGAYGYHRETTPALDRLAAEGALFENVVAESSWTLPTHATLFTGLGSLVHGVESFAGSRLSEAHRTVAERFQDLGYFTAGVYSGPYLHPVFGFGQGFETYRSVIESLLGPEEVAIHGPEAMKRIMSLNARAHELVTSERVSDEAIDLLEKAGGRPFFLFLHYFDVHYDYAPPEELWRRFDPDYRGSLDAENYRRNPAVHPGMDPRDLEHVLALYDGEILYTDRQIERVLTALERRGLTESTLVAVTSDHGEEFFEHGRKGHAQSLYDEVLLVPLILRLPGRIPAGTRIEQQVRHLDVAPTVLSLAGAKGGALEGEDLSGSLARGTEPPPRPALSSLRRNGHWLSLRTRRAKYLVHRDGARRSEFLYDLRSDPGELRPLIVESERAADAGTGGRDALSRWRRELRRREEAALALRGAGRDEQELDLPEEILDQLRSLGYLSKD